MRPAARLPVPASCRSYRGERFCRVLGSVPALAGRTCRVTRARVGNAASSSTLTRERYRHVASRRRGECFIGRTKSFEKIFGFLANSNARGLRGALRISRPRLRQLRVVPARAYEMSHRPPKTGTVRAGSKLSRGRIARSARNCKNAKTLRLPGENV